MEQLKENARQADARAADARNAAADRAAASREANGIRQQMVDLQKAALDERRQNHLDVLNAKRESQGQKPLTLTDVLKLQTASGKVEDTARFASTFDDKYAGVMGEPQRMSGTYNPMAGKQSKDAANWWNDYQSHKNAVRKELFGTALTSQEKGEWEKSDISTSMQPDQIRRNLERRQQLEAQAYAKLEAAAGAGTRSDQLKAIAPRTESLPMITPLPGGGSRATPATAPSVGMPSGWTVTTKPGG
jgi:hypothetical protein